MLAVFIRVLLVLASAITGTFIERNELNFDFIQTIIATLLFTLLVTIIAFWPELTAWIRRSNGKR